MKYLVKAIRNVIAVEEFETHVEANSEEEAYEIVQQHAFNTITNSNILKIKGNYDNTIDVVNATSIKNI